MIDTLPTRLQPDGYAVQQHAAAIVQIVAARWRPEIEIELVWGERQPVEPQDVVARPQGPDFR